MIAINVIILSFLLLVVLAIASDIAQRSMLIFIVSIMVMPAILFFFAKLYSWILIGFFDASEIDADKIVLYGLMAFSVMAVIGMFLPSYKHQTKSGKADRRYKDNPDESLEFRGYTFFLLLWVALLAYLDYKFFNFLIVVS
ncbi:MAG: hypothetical protein Q4E16_04175 [Neisseria sp.]|nr:hypothetical protein [Neisseria sp.]